MSECHRIADQMRRGYDGDAWHGPSLVTVLDRIPAQRAFEPPIAGARPAAGPVGHIALRRPVAPRRTEGEAVNDADHHDWRPLDPAAADWDELRRRLAVAHAALVARVEGLDDARLEESVPGQAITLYVMLHGVVQHDLYHAGQLALLARALEG